MSAALSEANSLRNSSRGPGIGGTRVPLRVQDIKQPPWMPSSEPTASEGKRVAPLIVSAARWSTVMFPSGMPFASIVRTPLRYE